MRRRIRCFPGSFEQRHPIVVAAAPTSIDLYPVGGALDERSMANIRAFAERYRHYGSGAVMIQTPAGTNPNSIAVYEVRRALARRWRQRQYRRGRLPARERRRRAAGARVVHGAQGDRSDAMRSVAGGPCFGIVGRRMEERALLELRLRHANRRSRLRSTTRAISSSRARSAHPTSPCAPEPSRPSATARIRARSGRTPCLTPIGAQSAAQGQ